MRRERIGFVTGFALVMALFGWLAAGASADVKDTSAKAGCCARAEGAHCCAGHEACKDGDAKCCAHADGKGCAEGCCAHDGKDARACASGCCGHEAKGAKDKAACAAGCCKGHETSGASAH